MADPLFINSISPLGSGRFYADISTDKGNYIYVPQEFIFKGLRQGDTQFFDSAFLNKDYISSGQQIRIDPSNLPESLRNAGYSDPSSGLLFSVQDYKKYDPDAEYVWNYNAVGQFAGGIQGIGEKDGKPTYVFSGANGSNYGLIGQDNVPYAFSQQKNKKVFGIGGWLGETLGNVASGITDFVASVPFLPEAVAFATGNPVLYGSLKAAQTAGKGGDLEATLKSGITSGAAMAAGQSLLGPSSTSGTEGFAAAADEVGGAGGFLSPPSVPSIDYSLLGSANLPTQAPGMGGGTGISATLPPLPEPSAIGIQPIDYGLSGQTLPGIVGGIGLQQPTMPNIGVMGGGQGVTVPVEGGTVGALGFTPENAVPVLGSPGSFINQPEVLGQPVMQQGTPTSPISVQDALRGARMINNLLTPQQPQVPNLLQRGQQVAGQAGGVDYSALLSLLSQRASTPGLLGTRYQPQSINLASLLG